MLGIKLSLQDCEHKFCIEHKLHNVSLQIYLVFACCII